MHVVSFTLKRANRAVLKTLHAIAAREGLTPARFDILYVLHVSRHRAPYQFKVAQWLGVTRATVCKLIRALRAIGFVELQALKSDRRIQRIVLTPFGRRSFGRVLRAVRRGAARKALRLAYRSLQESRALVSDRLAQIVLRVERLSRGLGEHTTLYRVESA